MGKCGDGIGAAGPWKTRVPHHRKRLPERWNASQSRSSGDDQVGSSTTGGHARIAYWSCEGRTWR
jgi:hypothetical protein